MNSIPTAMAVPDPEWWSQPDVLPILAGRDITALYNWLQKKHGLSQQRIAALTGQSQPEVSAIMHGRKVHSYDVLVRAADGLRIPRVLMGLGTCAQCVAHAGPAVERAGGDDLMERREFLTAASVAAAGGSIIGLSRWLPGMPLSAAPVPARIGASDVAQLRVMAAHLRTLDDRYGGGAMLDAARGFVGWAQGMLHSEYDEATGRDLRAALCELYADVGWSAHDAGRHAEARRHQARALVLARETGQPGQVAQVLFQIDRISLEWGEVAAPRVSELGLALGSDECWPGTTSELHGNVAWVAALRGDAPAFAGAIGRADEAMARAEGVIAPIWARQSVEFNSGRSAGRGWLTHYGLMSRHPEHRRHAETAVELGTRAVADQARGRRGLVHDRALLAEAQLRVGDREAGLANAHRALDDWAGLRSARTRMRLADLCDAAADHAGHPGADDLRARIAAG
jgi:transcriptional regulator with XRE-family HTH domain